VDSAYRENWLFHGPRYRGLVGLDALGDNGIEGRLKTLAANGGTLDNAGQVYGMWIALIDEVGRIAMPLRIRSVAFYEPEPAPGAVLDCRVWIRQFYSSLANADVELVHEGRLLVRIEGWEDWLFETTGRLYPLYRYPSRSLLARPDHRGFVILEDPGWLSTTVDFLKKRYLSADERAESSEKEGSRRYPEWLRGRIAAKDAVRRLLFESGHAGVYPGEVGITSDADGRPIVTTSTGRDIRVSLAHKGNLAVAIAAEGGTPGIDVERIEDRGDGFSALAFHDHELALLPPNDRAAWLTRLWCAKEAYGKSRGTGLGGNPKSLTVHRLEGERLLVEDGWVDTTVIGQHIVAWART
jgi:phosphopantetheinyl transferase